MIHAGAKLFTQGQFPFDKDISKHQSRQRRIKNDGKVVNRGTQTSSKSQNKRQSQSWRRSSQRGAPTQAKSFSLKGKKNEGL